MKEHMNRLARGVFQYEPVKPVVSHGNIKQEIEKGREFKDSFTVSAEDGGRVKGIVYSDCGYVKPDNETFYGEKNTIFYTVDTQNIDVESTIIGNFYIVSDGGEITVPFCFAVRARKAVGTGGVVKGIDGLAMLAKSHPEEAQHLFETPDFAETFLGDDIFLNCLYEGISKGHNIKRNLEEFLVEAGEKKRVGVNLENEYVEIEAQTEDFRGTVNIELDTWGYVQLYVSTDCDFIKTEKVILDSEQFVGGRYELAYIVDVSKLHGGNNYGRIYLENAGVRCFCRICVKAKGRKSRRDNSGQLLKLYIDFRTHKTDAQKWVEDTKSVIAGAEDTLFNKLLLAQLHIMEDNPQAAKVLIEDVKNDINVNDEDKYPLYCYFMYVNSLYNKDMLYSKKAAALVKECYKANEDWKILWMLMFMDGELEQNKSLKLLRLKEQFNKGCNSPALLLEAACILNEQPHFLRVMNLFEINVLNFAAKYDFISDKLIKHAANLMLGVRVAVPCALVMMENLYKVCDDEIVLESLCRLLIRAGKIGGRYLLYYGKAIEGQLKITNLFEYYIMSRKGDDYTPLPKMLLMYFGYNNNLDYRRKAYLYANIISNKDKQNDVYMSYLPQMELFVKSQLAPGRVNTNLSIVYNEMLNIQKVAPDNAGGVSEIYFTYKIQCDNPKMKSVVVRHKESNSEKEYPLTGGIAFVRIYTDNAVIMFNGTDGNRYARSIDYSITRLFNNPEIAEKCYEEDDTLIHALIYLCSEYLKTDKKDSTTVSRFIKLSKISAISKIFKRKLIGATAEYYYDSFDTEGFDAFVSDGNMGLLRGRELIKIIEIYTIRDMYDEAYELIKNADYRLMVPKRLLRLCSGLIEKTNELIYDSYMLKLCSACCEKERPDKNVLSYLAKYFYGSTDKMIWLWEMCRDTDIDAYGLMERIIVQIIFTHSNNMAVHELFEEYFARGPKNRVVEAYFAYYSYLNFVKDVPVPESFFELLETEFENEAELHIVCKMALTHYYSELGSLSEFQKELTKDMIMELIRKSYVFSYFEKLCGYVKIPYNVSDKTIAQYKTNPHNKVVIHYVIEDKNHRKNYVAEEMKNIYEGIFIKEFTVFYGETLEYQIWEEKENETVKTEKTTISNNKVSPDRAEGRYEHINDMLAARQLHDGDTLDRLIHKYAVNEYVVEKLFEPM